MERGYKDRYPGIRAFEEEEQYLFFGRKQQSRRLLSMVNARRSVVLFSKSGIGKSSLLNAGLIPLLDSEFYQPVKVRFQDRHHSPLELLKGELMPFLDTDILNTHTNLTVKEAPLWEFIRACKFGESFDEAYYVLKREEVVPVIIFDQFEEFFEHSIEDQEALISGLADLLSERLPERIQDELRNIPRRKRNQSQRDWYTPLSIKVIFSIRSDRLSLMDSLSDRIPTILKHRFHLKPLMREQASEAIIQPALMEGPEFKTPIFNYKEETLNLILDQLQNKNGEIESFQLQLLCRQIENKIEEKYVG